MNSRTTRCLLSALVVLVCASNLQAGPVEEAYAARNIFSINTQGVYRGEQKYVIGTTNWSTNLIPVHPLDLAKGGTANFLAVLTAAFPGGSGWTFVTAANNLTNNSIKVHTYAAKGTPASAGAEIDVEYVPGAGDPTANMHWIQVVTDNHNITNNPGHGNNENIVDLASDNLTTPYYDTGTPIVADSRNFFDASQREGNAKHTWIADLYLVSGPNAAGQVTIYNGLQWGWVNAPEPSTFVMLGTALVGLAITRRKRLAALWSQYLAG